MCEGSGSSVPKDDPRHVDCPTLSIPPADDALRSREAKGPWPNDDERERYRLIYSLLEESYPSRKACIHDALLCHPAGADETHMDEREQPQAAIQTCQNTVPPHGDYDFLQWSAYATAEDSSHSHSRILEHGGLRLADAADHLADLNKKGEHACPGQRVLAVCFTLLAAFEVKECQAPECERRRIIAQHRAPPCQWLAFRALLTSVVACWTPNFLALLIDLIFERMPDSGSFYTKKMDPRAMRTVCVDLHGVLDLLRWAYRVVFERKGLDTHLLQLKEHHHAALATIRPGYEYRMSYMTRRLEAYDLCPRRLWDVASLCRSSGWIEADAMHMIAMLKDLPTAPSDHRLWRHTQCTAGSCVRANENTAIMHQAHRCESGDCQKVVYLPLELLDSAYADYDRDSQGDKWRQTAWSVDTPSLLTPSGGPYMALSHVWSDGTGIGLRGAGEVNQCLFDYFANFARALGCVGIWWDVICLPASRKQRSAALNSMLENYMRAAVTVVHDEKLAALDWRDDGSPAVALIFSDWFTRGWTAAELFASRYHVVKVVFRDPRSRRPVLKDLDTDILALDLVNKYDKYETSSWDRALVSKRMAARRAHLFSNWQIIPKMGHLIASDVIRQLRHAPEGSNHFDAEGRVRTLQELRGLLGTRTTSWPKDMAIIAGLLCLGPSFEFDSGMTAVEITKAILKAFSNIQRPELLHPECTMSPHGPWSWCPSSVFDLGNYVTITDRGRRTAIGPRANIRKDGTIFCIWKARPLYKNDHIYSTSTHPSIMNEVSVAQALWWSCLLLGLEENSKDFVLALRVPRPQQDGSPKTYIFCKWVACVRLRESSQNCRRATVSVGVVFGSEEEAICASSLGYADAAPVFMDPVYDNATMAEPMGRGATVSEEVDTILEQLDLPVEEQIARPEPDVPLGRGSQAACNLRSPASKPAKWISKLRKGIASRAGRQEKH